MDLPATEGSGPFPDIMQSPTRADLQEEQLNEEVLSVASNNDNDENNNITRLGFGPTVPEATQAVAVPTDGEEAQTVRVQIQRLKALRDSSTDLGSRHELNKVILDLEGMQGGPVDEAPRTPRRELNIRGVAGPAPSDEAASTPVRTTYSLQEPKFRESKLPATPRFGLKENYSLLHFIADCKLKFDCESQQYGTPEKQICFILAMLEGKAADFQLHVMARPKVSQDSEGAPLIYGFQTAQECLEMLEEIFSSGEKEADARAQLEKMHQGRKNAMLHIMAFDSLARHTESDDRSRAMLLRKSLNRQVREQASSTCDTKDAYEVQKQAFAKADRILIQLAQEEGKSHYLDKANARDTTSDQRSNREARAEFQRFTQSPRFKQPRGNTRPAERSPPARPYERPTARPAASETTPKQRETQRKEGRCFSCNEVGHLVRDLAQLVKLSYLPACAFG